MSKLIDISKLITLKNYSVKYGITNRKIYRYVDSNLIDHIVIDGVPFVYDKEYEELKYDHRYRNPSSNVKILTKDKGNDKILTIEKDKNPSESTLNKENDNVKILTKGNDKILTIEEQKLIDTPDIELSGSDLDKKYKLKKRIKP